VNERPRYLVPAAGYTTHPVRAVDRLEALSEDEQAEMIADAHQRVLDERIRRREAIAAEIARELDHLDARGRYLRRQLKRLQRVPS
jgi:hypothetical protein